MIPGEEDLMWWNDNIRRGSLVEVVVDGKPHRAPTESGAFRQFWASQPVVAVKGINKLVPLTDVTLCNDVGGHAC